MAITAVCKICKQTIQSLLIGDDREIITRDMGMLMLDHMGKQHIRYMQNLVELTKTFSGFIVMNRFTIADDGMEDEKEGMRDLLAERLMQDCPVDDDMDDEDEDGYDEDHEIKQKINPKETEQEREERIRKQGEVDKNVEESRKRGEPQEIKRRRKDNQDKEDKEVEIKSVES